jgi:hypothetical protein
MPDHLSRLQTGEDLTDIEDDLLDANLFRVEATPKYLEEITNFLEEGKAPKYLSTNKNVIVNKCDSCQTMGLPLWNNEISL